ncbi:MAG: hypothetical protein HEQ35_20485 [Gloeotrichia echinulata IR180]
MKNFSLTLYAFHLRHTLTEVPGEAVTDANLLWENLVKIGENSLPFSGLKDLRSKLVCYQNGKYEPKLEAARRTEWLTDMGALDLGSLPTTAGFNINANLQPFLLNDTYAVDLTLVPESSNIPIDISQLEYFQPKSLLPANVQASLGQMLWVYGEVEPNTNCDALARKFAIGLVAGTNLNPIFIKQGELFGSLLFEYQAIDPDEPDNPAKQCYISILINQNQSSTTELATKAYDWLLHLFCSYRKIHFVYQLALQRDQKAREMYSQLDATIEEFKQLMSATQIDLAKLKKLLTKLPLKSLDYNQCLQDIQAHHIAITTNITNYKICLEKIQDIDNGNSPQSWQEFLQKDCQQWQEQIQTYINYLIPGQELFGHLTNTIRGIVEIEQDERDRTTQELLQQKEAADKQRSDNLQTTIAMLGIGLSAAGIGSSTAPYIIPQQPTKQILPPFVTNQLHPLTQSLLFSLFLGIIGAFLGLGLSYLCRNIRKI